MQRHRIDFDVTISSISGVSTGGTGPFTIGNISIRRGAAPCPLGYAYDMENIKSKGPKGERCRFYDDPDLGSIRTVVMFLRGDGTTRPLPRNGGAEELHGDPTVGPHPKVWTIDRE